MEECQKECNEAWTMFPVYCIQYESLELVSIDYWLTLTPTRTPRYTVQCNLCASCLFHIKALFFSQKWNKWSLFQITCEECLLRQHTERWGQTEDREIKCCYPPFLFSMHSIIVQVSAHLWEIIFEVLTLGWLCYSTCPPILQFFFFFASLLFERCYWFLLSCPHVTSPLAE